MFVSGSLTIEIKAGTLVSPLVFTLAAPYQSKFKSKPEQTFKSCEPVVIKFMNMVIKKELCALKYCGPVKVKIVIDHGHNHDVTD